MLVLKRNIEQSIIIETTDGIIEIMVTSPLHLGVTAPKSVKIYRREIWEQQQAEMAKTNERKGN